MASPQIENGYTRIANELLDKLCSYRIPGEEWLVLATVIRKTYGFKKITDAISFTQFEKSTLMKRSNVVRAIRGLVSKKILRSIKSDTGATTTYSIEKDYDKWVGVIPRERGSIKSDTKSSINFVEKVVSKAIHTKDNIQKKERKHIGVVDFSQYNHLKDQSFNNMFNEFLSMRKAIRKPATPFAQRLILRDLQKVDISTAISMLEQSVKNSWQGVFGISKTYNSSTQPKGGAYGTKL